MIEFFFMVLCDKWNENEDGFNDITFGVLIIRFHKTDNGNHDIKDEDG